MSPYALIGYALLSIALIGGGALYGEDPFHLGHFLIDTLFLYAGLVIFLVLMPGRFKLPTQIFIGMIAGIGVGWGLQTIGKPELVTDYLAIFGEMFLLLLKMVIVPLVFVSVLLGVAGLGDVRKVGKLGGKTLVYYFSTTGVAVIIGLLCVNIIHPGRGLDSLRDQLEAQQSAEVSEGDGAEEEPKLSPGMTIQKVVLPNFLQSPVRTDSSGVPILAIIIFAILLGAALTADVEKSEPAVRAFQSIDKAMVTLVLWIMALAPIGVYALMARAVATLGIDYLVQLAAYVVTVLLGLILHVVVLILVGAKLLGGISPARFLRGMAPAMQVAFSTSSSSATLPVTIECAIDRVGINKGVARFMLPVGATINMDGTALYTSVASIFVAQVYGLDLTMQDQIMIFLTAIAVSVGTAGIPGASIAMMTIIFTAVDLPIEGIGLVLGVDRVLDMCRTTVNITGDTVGAAVVSRSEGVTGEIADFPR